MSHIFRPIASLSQDSILRLDAEYRHRYGLFDDMAMSAAVAARRRGWMQLDEFICIGSWKLSTSGSTAFEKATEEEIRRHSEAAFAVHEQQMVALNHFDRILGIGFRAASAFLHLAVNESYPMLDQRVFRSLGFAPNELKSALASDDAMRRLWPAFSLECVALSKEHGVTLRQLDRALWWLDKYPHAGE